MYILPQNYKCPKCGFSCKWGPHDPFPSPFLKDGPACPRCYLEFLCEHIPTMKRHGGDHE